MRGRNSVRELLRRRLQRRPGEQPEVAEHQLEGVIYLTPDGDGYILYASQPAGGAVAAADSLLLVGAS